MKVLKGIGYWFISYTWGIIMTLVGSFVALGLIITGHKPYRFHYNIYFIIKSLHGCGTEFGPFFIVSEDCKDSLHMKQHEAGHGLQNLWWGPLMPFVVCLPSAFRFWLRELKTQKQKYIYTSIVTGVVTLVGLAGIVLSATVLDSFISMVVFIFVTCYGCMIFSWAFDQEIPLYNPNLTTAPPKYDDIWFEGQASSLGEKYFLE